MSSDLLEEYEAVTRAAGVVALDHRGVIEMTGRDRARFLHGMCTHDIKKLQPGHGTMAAVVQRQGKMVAEIVVRATDHALLLEIERSNLQPAIDHLSRYVVADDVAIKPADLRILGLYGPASADIIGAGGMADFHFVTQGETLVSRDRMMGVEGFRLLVPAAGEAGTRARLVTAGARAVGPGAIEILRIENGFPRWGADMDATLLPMEAGLEPAAISYTKGCYIGQEVIQRVKTYSEPPSVMVHLSIKAPAPPAPGAPIRAGDRAVGRITSAAVSPVTGKISALGIVEKVFKNAGTRLSVEGGTATVAALPWHRLFTS